MGLLDGLSRGLSAAGYATADIFSQKALQEQRAQLEEEKALRIADAAEARRVAPMQRFSGLLGAKLEEGVPQEAEEVTATTSEGAKAAGYKDGLIGMTREQVAAYKDPDMLSQFDKQMEADNRLAEEKVAGKTRQRTQPEAIKAALDEALMKDPQAYVAGQEMTSGDRKTDIEERKLASREKIEQAKEEGRERRDERRFEAMMARIEAATGGKGGGATALRQNVELLRELGYGQEKIEKFIFDKKELPLEDVAAKIMAADSSITPEQAAEKAINLRKALNKPQTPTPDPKGRPSLESFMTGTKKPSRESSGTIKN